MIVGCSEDRDAFCLSDTESTSVLTHPPYDFDVVDTGAFDFDATKLNPEEESDTEDEEDESESDDGNESDDEGDEDSDDEEYDEEREEPATRALNENGEDEVENKIDSVTKSQL
jgi:hypothetical protein